MPRAAVLRGALGALVITGVGGIGLLAPGTGSGAAVLKPVTSSLSSRPAATGTSSNFYSVTVVPGTTHAIAVGTYYASSRSGPVVEEWNGAAWKAMPLPVLPGADSGSQLSGVWAASTSDAWAVGSAYSAAGPVPLLLHWNGKAWSLETLPTAPPNTALSGISGTSASNIWCVGSAQSGAGPVSISKPVEAHFNGSTWAVSTVGSSGTYLGQVSAGSPSNVWAIGATGNSGTSTALHFNGRSWSQVKTPVPSGSYVNSVSAKGPMVLMAGTSSTAGAFVTKWAGGRWTTARLPSPAQSGEDATSVVTLSVSSAWVSGTGRYGAGFFQLSRGRWFYKKAPAVGHGATVLGMAASSARNVWAVGDYFTGAICKSPAHPLSYHYTSGWRVIATAPVSAASAAATPARGATAFPAC
ncbi:MAG: beta propeller repeat protein [Acidimicrobiales bacterium]